MNNIRVTPNNMLRFLEPRGLHFTILPLGPSGLSGPPRPPEPLSLMLFPLPIKSAKSLP